MSRRVVIFDTTLRDGEQAPGNSLSVEEKVRLARQLEVLGVDVIEAGFPASSETDFRSVQEIAAAVRGPVIAALARCTERDIDLAGDAIRNAAKGRIHVFLSTSDLHLRAKLRITREEALERIAKAVNRARSFTDDVEWSAEDASRTDLGFKEVVDEYYRRDEVRVEEWVYGPRNGMYQFLRFEGNRLRDIDSKRGN